MDTTQTHLPISDINQNIILLKDGGASLVLQTGAVNFGLLSEREQLAIISAFAQMLNSLSFPIQIVIDSKKLDLSSYLELLNKVQVSQTNALLSELVVKYRTFIQATVKENEVLDKRFYLVISVSRIELGFISSVDKDVQLRKALNILQPRKDQIIRQLSRIGLKGTQLKDQELFDLFYEIYNRSLKDAEKTVQVSPVKLATPVKPQPVPPVQSTTQTPTENQSAYQSSNTTKTHPFVVEELPE